MSQTTLCRNFGVKKGGGGRTFEGGVLAGHYDTLKARGRLLPLFEKKLRVRQPLAKSRSITK